MEGRRFLAMWEQILGEQEAGVEAAIKAEQARAEKRARAASAAYTQILKRRRWPRRGHGRH